MFEGYLSQKERKNTGMVFAAFLISSAGIAFGLVAALWIQIHYKKEEKKPGTAAVLVRAQKKESMQSTPQAQPKPIPAKPIKATARRIQITTSSTINTNSTTPLPSNSTNSMEGDKNSDGVDGEGDIGGENGGGGGEAPPPAPPLPPKPKVVPAIMIKKDKISGEDPHLPESVKSMYRQNILTATYKICIAREGYVSTIDVIQGIFGADAVIMEVLKTWRYKPQAIPICFIQFLEYHIG